MEAPLPRPKQHPKDAGRRHKTAVLENFAKGLSSLGDGDSKKAAWPNYNLQSLFSSDLDDGAVVLTIPALDLKNVEAKVQDVLPTLGEHATENIISCVSLSSTHDDLSISKYRQNQNKPDMAASVFAKANEGLKEIEDQNAVEAISRKTSWTKSTISYASSAVCANVSRTFQTLLNSRLRAWTLLLLRHSLSTGSNESRSQLLGMLAAKIEIVTAEVAFKTLSLPDEAAGIKPKDSDAVLPLLFEASIKISIQGKQERVGLKAPGTISAIFENQGLKLVNVNVKLDAKMMMKAMVDHSRLAVLQAVSVATCTAPDLVKDQLSTLSVKESNDFPLPRKRPPSKNALSSLAAAKTSPTTDQSPEALKARSSAVRLDNILQGKTQSGPFFSSRLIRAATKGENAKRKIGPILGALAPEPKMARVAQSAAKLKSFKSFGRPHAGDVGSGPNNATFGEFGSGHSGIWGRDGGVWRFILSRCAVDRQPTRMPRLGTR